METWQTFSAAVGLPPAAIAAAAVAVLVAVVGITLWIRSRRRSRVRLAHARETGAVPSVGAPVQRPMAPLARGLSRTRAGLLQRLLPVLARERLDPASVAELEEALLAADVGVRMTDRLVRSLDRPTTPATGVRERLEREVLAILRAPLESAAVSAPSAATPHVIMVVGVNGVGKTTTIGKLAARFRTEGKRTLVVAADTFRAAAIEQLAVWAERTGSDLVKHQHGADPGAVVFDGLRAAQARGADVVIVDTAGRLHTKTNLMEELRKVRRVAAREIPGAPHETLLVIDAVTGQNGIVQARAFLEHLEVSGIVLTKLDGTAKGGVVVAIAGELGIPIRYVGVGEGADDLREFDPQEFAAALLAPAEPADSLDTCSS
jgi:fused signal recognition particle receptor